MSARDLLEPNRALEDLLRSYQNRVISAGRRMRYPGGSRMVELSSGTLTGTLQTMLFLNLERGRWTIIGGFYDTFPAVTLFDFVSWQIQTRFVAGSVISPSHYAGQGRIGPDDARIDNVMTTWSYNAPSSFLLSMQISTSMSPMPINNVYLIAIPG